MTMEDIEYLLDRIAFLEDRLAHLESILMPREDTSQTNLLEVYRKIQDEKKRATAAIYTDSIMTSSFTSASVDKAHEKLHKSFKEYYRTTLRGDL
jgi:hypothetical protein|tara:strand:- start:58 stop:342 length:285 start_codon:yes stop_codon:yes gene_type:complete